MPTSPSRRAAGVTLTLNTNTSTSGYRKPRDPNYSPPRTPPGTRSRRALRERDTAAGAAASTPRETFLDDSTPVDFARSSPHARRADGERHSHDLSLAPEQVTRDSLVNNMLLSLDQFSLGGDGGGFGVPGGGGGEERGLYNSFGGQAEEEDEYAGYEPRRGNGGGRQLGHGHSYSEDYDHQDAASRASSQYTRTRRSNSSSNYTTTTTGRHHASNSGSVGTPRQTAQNRGAHPRERKESKDSSVSSSDMGQSSQAGNGQRWASGYGNRGRSSSFDDYGQETQMPNIQRQRTLSSPTEQELEPYDIYDAAPTPTVPVGPRRQRPLTPNGVYTADTSTPSPKTRNVQREQSSRAPKTLYQKRAETSHGLGNPMNNGHDENRRIAAMPAFKKEEPAPAPLVTYGKGKNNTAPANGSKPGFFRRVFGSKGNTPGAPSTGSVSSPGSTISGDPMERPPSNKHQAQPSSRVQTAHGYPSPQPAPRAQKEPPKAISKKPSSFFKRRKKSVSEPEVPAMPLQLVLVKDQEVGQDLASPTSSLRQVMNQYLNSPITQPGRWDEYDDGRRYGNDEDDDSIEEATGFSPGYTPDKSATIRSVNPTRRDAEPRRTPLVRNNTSQSQLGTDGSGDDRTFFQDNSDNDKDGNRIVSQTLTVKADPASKDMAHSPNSVARDKALVAEYEQKYSKRQPARKADNPMLSLYPSPGGSPKSKKEEGDGDNEGTVRGKGRGLKAEEKEKTSSISLPLEGMKGVESSESSPAVFHSATSRATAGGEAQGMTLPTPKDADEQIQPTTFDWERAKKIYDGNEDFIQKSKAAAWLGEDGAIRRRTLLAYMELYDFKDMDILGALRALCNRLVLKAESQQVDRILDVFATRWCQCNPNHGFKITDVVHTICYSILLLNTDLHMADIESKMTKSQFVKNTIPTILRVVADAAPEAFEPSRPTILSPKFEVPEPDESRPDGGVPLSDNMRALRDQVNAFEPDKMPLRPPGKSLRPGSMGPSTTSLNQQSPLDDCGPLVRAPFQGTLRAWEGQVELVLKEFYNGIRNERLPLFGAPAEQPRLQQASQSSLSVFGTNKLRRTPSIVSKAGSESMSFSRGRTADAVRLNTGKWTNKHRSRPRVYPNSMMGSSRTSLDDQSSIWSPSQSSSTWSKYSLGKTQTSMSVNSLDSNYPQGDYQQSIGFANALSQAIIREEHVGSADGKSEDVSAAPLLEDESLELHGAPWAKEGIVKHKHHLEAADKKAKDRNWAEVFVVIEKGYMSLFSFSSKSVRQKSSSRAKGAGVVVGGGNWQDNAENLGSFLLRQTIASTLPSPGYSKARPHVFALSLPTGAVHLFQVGTPEIVKEFVSTANYWSARLSNHPLVGGISNIEYGWSDAVINNSLVSAIQDAHPPSSAAPPTTTTTAAGGVMGGGRASMSGPRPSLQSSLRSSLDQGAGAFKARLPGDKITISEWAPPTQSMRASSLEEGEQLGALEEYVRGVEEELMGHNRLRGAMMLAFTPRAPNAHKAMANWERKSSYLLREIVKFKTYIDCLLAARAMKEKIYREREERKESIASA
ncbi:hypothetical protein V492_04572 [Pseudogymnoascus sp. VKM F-4246]|nr:hypothetical protein V492_04572 [Pseudogymnoascus sp. VKM F-4246]